MMEAEVPVEVLCDQESGAEIRRYTTGLRMASYRQYLPFHIITNNEKVHSSISLSQEYLCSP